MLPFISTLFFGVALADDKRENLLRGVAPNNFARYTSEKFTCADGSLTIPQYMVNDDYCDCNDGTDEPGTSACRKGVFYCANKGFQNLYIPSSRVNDGICDCCDGSDEWQLKVSCHNNCVELGRESMKDLISEVEKYEAGVVKLKSLIKASQGLKAEKDSALSEANEKLTALESALKDLETQKNVEEAVEKAEQDKRAPPPPEATPIPPTPEAQTNNEATKEEEGTTKEGEDERFPYPKEYQYKGDEQKEGEKKIDEEKFPYPAEYAYKGDKADDKNEESGDSGEDTEPETPEAPAAPSPPTVEKYVSDAAEAARSAFRDKENEVRTARETRDKLQKELSHDFGAHGEYMSLLGSCFDTPVRQYTYEMCPYGSSAQKEGSSSTSLGNWEGFEKKENGQLIMKFGGGQRCWQGPERSFLVEVVCGIENQLSNVDEPSKCVYTARLATPAACTEARAKELREQLDGLLAHS